MPMSDYGANLYASVIVRGASAPATLYLALLGELPGPAMDGTDITAFEPSGAGYARVAIPTGSAHWSEPSDGSSAYDTAVSFSPTGDWGLVAAYALCTEATGGQVLMFAYLSTAVSAQEGSTIQVPANALVVGVVS